MELRARTLDVIMAMTSMCVLTCRCIQPARVEQSREATAVSSRAIWGCLTVCQQQKLIDFLLSSSNREAERSEYAVAYRVASRWLEDGNNGIYIQFRINKRPYGFLITE